MFHSNMESHNGDIHNDGNGVVEYDEVLTVFHASPLVSIEEDGEISPLNALSQDREHHYLAGVLDEEIKIRLDHHLCTPQAFGDFLRNRGRLLHYACHAEEGKVYLEQAKGAAQTLQLTELQSWIQQGSLEFVVVADSDPEMQLIEAFRGVPHIVCCPVAKYKLDEAALVFCQALYKSLANLQTVQQAFLDASKAVQDSTHLSYTGGRQAIERYRLLPEGENHDVVLFQRKNHCQRIQALTLPPLRVLPQPPPEFVGRQSNIYQLLKDLEEARLIRIKGGMGSASIVKSACQYMARRREEFSHEIVWLPPRLGQLDGMTLLCLRIFDSVVNLEDPMEDDLVTLLDTLEKHKVLLVCDIREWEKSKDVFHGLMDFLDEVFDLTGDTRAIVIEGGIDADPIALSSNYVEKIIEVKPLGYASTVSLFALLCPHVSKRTVPSITCMDDLNNLLVPSAGYVGNANLKMTIIKIYNLLGSGNPSRIRELAMSMTKEEYEGLIQVGKLRLKLSRLYQKHIEMTFPTRYSLDSHLADLSESIENARRNRKLDDVRTFEAEYLETGNRRKDLPSIATMLTKRKAFKTDFKFAKLSGRIADADVIFREICTIEKLITKEREAMLNDGEDWMRLSYVEYPRGISRRALEDRYVTTEHLLFDARKTNDFRLARELEFPLKELRDCIPLLLRKSEWVQRREWLNQEVKDAEAKGDVDTIVKLNDQMEEIEMRLADEEGNVDATRISDDLYFSLDAFLRFTGDPCASDLPLFENLSSRAEAEQCLSLIKAKAEISSEKLDMGEYSTLLGLYMEVCGIIKSKFPSIEALLIERRGLKLEMSLVFSDEQEIVRGYNVEIESIEERILQQRREFGPDEYYGVCKDFYYYGITRSLVDKRILQLKRSLDQAHDEDNAFEMEELDMRLAELLKHQERLPTASEMEILVARTDQDLQALRRRPGNETKKQLMELAIQELQERKDAETKPKYRTMPDVADELLISDQDYFYPPMNDSLTDLNGDDESSGENAADGGDLSTVDEISVEEDQASDDHNHF